MPSLEPCWLTFIPKVKFAQTVQEFLYSLVFMTSLLKKYCKRSTKIKLGDPMNLETQMGALISAEHLDKIMGYIEKAKLSGARLVCGGNRHDSNETRNGYFVEPTIFADCEDGSPMLLMKFWVLLCLFCVLNMKTKL